MSTNMTGSAIALVIAELLFSLGCSSSASGGPAGSGGAHSDAGVAGGDGGQSGSGFGVSDGGSSSPVGCQMSGSACACIVADASSVLSSIPWALVHHQRSRMQCAVLEPGIHRNRRPIVSVSLRRAWTTRADALVQSTVRGRAQAARTHTPTVAQASWPTARPRAVRVATSLAARPRRQCSRVRWPS